MGAASSTIISYIIIMIMLIVYCSRLMVVSFEWVRIIKIILVTAIIFCIGYFINIENIVASIFFKLFIIILYPFLLYLTKFFKSSEIERFKGSISVVLKKIKKESSK
jgi:hypothetical protein